MLFVTSILDETLPSRTAALVSMNPSSTAVIKPIPRKTKGWGVNVNESPKEICIIKRDRPGRW